MISMNQVWDDSVAFIRREAALLVPLALATLFVGDVVVTLASAGRSGTTVMGPQSAAVLGGAIWIAIGQLAIVALVLTPGLSVGEALGRGAARIGKIMIVALMGGFAFAFLMAPAIVALNASGFDPADAASVSKVPAWATLYGTVGLGVALWVAIRLALLNALIIDRNPGVFGAIRTSFALTRGITARLAVCMIIYVIVSAVLGGATRFVSGSLFAMAGAAAGSPFLGVVLTALVTALVSSGLSAVVTVFLATLYRRASTRS